MIDEQSQSLREAINEHLEKNQEDSRRDHLGASLIGRPCDRQIWYDWRWSNPQKHSGRMLRLFNRGHREEDRFMEWLLPVCEKFWPIDPRTGKQINVSDYFGYFGGSLDGVMRNPRGYEKGDYLTEFKTHNDKSFQKLTTIGVKDAKPEHYAQMQTYLHYKTQLKAAIYVAINKNDDSLYIETIEKNESWWLDNVKPKVERILLSRDPPKRMEMASPNYFYCKHFCTFKDQCWDNANPAKSCRTCAFVKVTDEGWKCGKTTFLLSSDKQRIGCDQYERLF